MNQRNIPLSGPDITDSELQAVIEVLGSGRLSIGPHTEAFEAAVASRAGRKYGIAVNSGTSGLHLCVRALGIGENDEVITTPFSFVATTNCLLFERARPVFVDVDPESYNMNPALIEAAITPKTKAILPVEVFGNMAHFNECERIARKHNLLMIEDSCEALGGVLSGRPAGNFGECGVFAFYPNKQITTGEGGLIITDSEEIRDLCRSMRNQGRDTQTWCVHERLGYNYRMSEITAVLGLSQMHRLDDVLTKRRQIAETYNTALADIEQIHLPPMTERENASWFVYVIRLVDEFSVDKREAILDDLRKKGIGCENYFPAIHLQPFIQENFEFRRGDFPVCEALSDRTIALPFFTQMKPEQIETVAGCVKDAISNVCGTRVRIPIAAENDVQTARPKTRQVPFCRVTCDGNEL
ncbi:MAG: DegT/DnrJ/EryC1/StrS family aminotransferase, partial [Planctomycetota bacterium]|nr:DegT/DnrJ/EryC1/StrS family aminotransferase [Planctomycetota bacterium]